MVSSKKSQLFGSGDGVPADDVLLKSATIIGMVGGPGSGKGTQSQRLSQAHGIAHISSGDVLRQEINRPESEYADIIRENMMNGKIGPKEITIPILRGNIMRSFDQGQRTFVLDGFPRNKEQSDYFEKFVCPLTCLLIMDNPESIVIERRARSNRNHFDDNLVIIHKRLETFHKN